MAIQPTLALIPAAQGSKFYSVLPSNGVGDFDFTRASTATRINSKGLIEEVASGVSRLDYTGGGCPHHLLEPQSLNSQNYSEDLSSGFLNGATSELSNVIISPDGTLNADKLVESNTNARHELYGATLSFSGTTSVSFFAKAEERRYISVFIGGDPSGGGATFDVQDGIVSLTSGGTDASIVKLSNGWFRCSLASTKVASTAVYYCLRTDGNAVNVQTYQGDGTSGMYLWGFQTVVGQSFPTSYIKTTSSAVTRLAETADNAGNAATFNDSEGVLFAEISALANGSFRYITLSDGTDSNNVQFGFFPLPKQVQFEVSSGGSSQLSYLDTNIDVLFNTKLLIKYKQNDFSIYVNGFEVHTDSSGLSPIGLDRICFDRGDGCGDNFYGKTKKLEYYNTTLTSLEMETLTSYTSFNEMALNFNYTI